MKPLTIGVEATAAGSAGAEKHGVYRYIHQLLLGFKAINEPHRFRLWFNAFRRSQRNSIQDFLSGIDWPQVESAVSVFPPRIRRRLKMPIDKAIGPVDLFHGPTHILPYFRNIKTVVTIHDLAFFKMSEPILQLNPDWCDAIKKRSHCPKTDLLSYRSRCDFFLNLRKEVPEALARADRIIAVSNATAKDLVSLTGVPEAKISVIPNGLTPNMSPVKDELLIRSTLSSLGIKKHYILYVGVLDPNKNLHTLISAFAQTSAMFRGQYQLVIAGPRNWFQSVLEEEAERLGIKELIRFTGYVSDEILPVLYSGAVLSVSPSPLEGFGFPVIESMACGTPVIIVNAGALPEIAGDAAIRVEPKDTQALASEIERLAKDPVLHKDIANRGFVQCRNFSWDISARSTLDVYTEVAG